MTNRGWSLKWLFLIGTAVLVILPALSAGVIYTSKVRKQTFDLLTADLNDRGEWGAAQIVQRLDQLWQQVSAMSKEIDLSNLPKLRDKFTQVTQIDQRFSWLGIADIDGKVLISSNGMLENLSVTQRPWFREGLQGPFAGDVHEAVLLQNLLPKRDEPYRFVDFSMPIKNQSGQTVGVFGAHFDWAWIKQLVDGFRTDSVDVLLLSQDHRVLHGPANLYGQQLATGSAVAASVGARSSRIEQWPDGHDYLAISLPIRSATDAPSFGWSFAVRRNLAEVGQQSGQFLRTFWTLTGAAVAVTMLGFMFFIAWITLPITRAALFAVNLAENKTAGAPEEVTGCREARQLTASLTKLQSQLTATTQLRRAG